MPTLRKKLLFSLIPVVVILVSAELLLRLFGYHGPSADPFDSFVLHTPLFESDGPCVRTAPSRRRYFHDQRILREKLAGVRRILFLGGSATWGWELPDPRKNAFPFRSATLIERNRAGAAVEAVNCGGIAYASYRLVGVLEECLAYGPDAVVVMCGNNEFIEARHYGPILEKSATRLLWHDLRLGQLALSIAGSLTPRDAPARGDEVVLGDEISEQYIVRTAEERELTLRHYARNLERMIDLCREAGVPIVLMTVPSNIGDFAPFRTEAYGGQTREEVARRLEEAIDLFDAKRYATCLHACRREEELDPERPAAFFFLKANTLEAIGRHEEALQWFIKARDSDAFPHRAPSAFNDAVRRIAVERETLLLDAERLFSEKSPSGIPGKELFVDQCHPNVAGHRLLAQALSELLGSLLYD